MAQKTLKVNQEELERIIESAIKKYVNGKIDRIALHLTEQDAQLDEIKPLLEGIKTTKVTSRILVRIVVWTFGFMISIASAYLLFNQVIKTLFP